MNFVIEFWNWILRLNFEIEFEFCIEIEFWNQTLIFFKLNF